MQTLAGVVDQDVDPAEAVDRPRHECLDLARNRHVCLNSERVSQLRGERFETIRPASRNHDPRSAFAQQARGRCSDTRRGSRDYADRSV